MLQPTPQRSQTTSPIVLALLHSYASNSPLVTMGCLTFNPKITPSRGLVPKPNYLPSPWTYPTYHPEQHLYLISRVATMHWTDTQTNRWLEGMFDDYRKLSLYREQRRGLIIYNFTPLYGMASYIVCSLLIKMIMAMSNVVCSTAVDILVCLFIVYFLYHSAD